MKKLFKIIGILLSITLLILISVPYFLESKIETIVQNYADENLNAKLSFKNINLSLIRSFPQAEISIEALKINTLKPFEDETLVAAKALAFEMPLTELFKGTEEPLIINQIIADELLLTLKTNASGNVNYNITKAEDNTNTQKKTSNNKSFSFDIEHYELNNCAFTYIDETSNTSAYITGLTHTGNGIFSEDRTQLDTETKLNITLAIDSTEYINNTNIKLDAVLDLDLKNNTYTFKENKGLINALPIEFDGYVKLLEKGQEIDLNFHNTGSTFKDFLAVIPKTFTKDIENIKTTGKFSINGDVKGVLSEKTIPTLDIKILSNNASFKYQDLPKSVKNIEIDASIVNKTGNIDDTFVDLNTLDFKIDKDIFKSEAHIKNLTKNITVNANLDGVLNLSNITKAYPIELENELSGILRGNLNTSFDMNAIETNAYQRIKNNGNVAVEDFIFSSEDIVNPLHISTAKISLTPSKITLDKFEARTGKSDINVTGAIDNLLGFLLSDKKLKGNFNVNSENFTMSDFMAEDKTAPETSNKNSSNSESLKIPDFLDCTILADAKNVYYDNLNLKNVTGTLKIKDQNADLSNITTDIFNGQLGLSGNVTTKGKIPKFNMNLAIQKFDISQSFKDLEMLRALVPIAKVLKGKLNSTIKLNGALDKDFTPNLKTITGNALAELLTVNISENQSKLLQNLNNNLTFIDFNKLDLKDVKTKLAFENGQVAVKPFTIKYKDIPIEVSGTHSFTNKMNYSAVLQVPAKHLGSDINRLIGKLNDPQINNISVPVTTTIGGDLTNPKITTDLKSSIKNLTSQLLEIQKQKLINKGTEKVGGLIGELLGNKKDNKKTDSTTTTKKDNVKEGVKSILGGFLNKKKKKN